VAPAAAETADGGSATVLVVAYGYQVTNGVRSAQPNQQSLRVSLTRAAGAWLMSDVQNVSV
jgi:hypothetical protein